MKLSFKGYIRYLRRQNVHIQRLHAGFFAGFICLLLASVVLYTQYGFWHTTYVRRDEQSIKEAKENTVPLESPLESLARLFKEGKERFSGVTNTLKPLVESEVTFDRNASTTP